jgi:acyl-CoA reductase-like NAD-dependent aldehyde dehydrogenase
MSKYGRRRMLIGGELVESASGNWIDSINPATEEPLGAVPNGSADDVDRAVQAAARAQREWAGTTMGERRDLLEKVAAAVEARADEILEMEIDDTGNTWVKMRSDVGYACENLRHFAGLGLEQKGESVPVSPTDLNFTIRQPYGVVGRINPFNHPINFAVAKIAAPLMAGNSVVIKPSEQSPLSSSLFAEVCAEVVPAGLVNIVTGDRVTGEALVRHPDVPRIAFIGSNPAGRAIQRAASEVAVKHVSLELGGKNPLIAFPDADPQAVAAAAVRGMNFGHQGQSCGSTSRLLVHESLADEVISLVADKMGKLRLGNPHDHDSEMGAINSAAQYEKVKRFIEVTEKEGACLVTGGRRPEGKEFERGFWMQPTMFADVTPDMTLFREEVFGPILAVTRWSDVDEVLAMANSTEYGLTASIWTNDLKRAFDTAKRVESGYVWINGTSAHHLGLPFSGWKNSGLGSEEGIDELLSYTRVKTLNVLLG